WERYNLLPASANVYLKGNYIGTTEINLNAKDTLEIGLGRDDGILMERNQIRKKSERKVLGKEIKEVLAHEIVVRNTKSETVNITIEDQIPIAENKKIEIELLENPENGLYLEKEGKLRWTKSIEPGASVKLSYQYKIKFPKYETLYVY
ncbi:MAG: DUF4139 domain-containing protein, partial [Flavobacteriales bacterium]|nr:DUF4139 domain-containing protein [Flavobacteriales bacterium]